MKTPGQIAAYVMRGWDLQPQYAAQVSGGQLMKMLAEAIEADREQRLEAAWQMIVDFHDDHPGDNPEYARGQIELFTDMFGMDSPDRDGDEYRTELWNKLAQAVRNKSRQVES